jgi:CDP-diacylglycerol--serine O-phosphatidyltransferase
MFVASVSVLSESRTGIPLQNLTGNTRFLLIVTVVLSALMVTNIRMFSLKFENISLKKNWLRYSLLILSLIILIVLGIPGIALIIAFYIIISVAADLTNIKI